MGSTGIAGVTLMVSLIARPGVSRVPVIPRASSIDHLSLHQESTNLTCVCRLATETTSHLTMTVPWRRTACLLLGIVVHVSRSIQWAPEDYLQQGDELLASGFYDQAIDVYQRGVALRDDEDRDMSLSTEVSLFTNLATALSSYGQDKEAAKHYQNALAAYKNGIEDIVDNDVKEEATAIASQAAFFLGMVYQDTDEPQEAVDAYRYAIHLDPRHWASWANLGAVLHDELVDHSGALEAYNKAYSILTSVDQAPTDPPPDPRYILSQLQYRIGLCITHDTNRKCALQDDPDTPVDCNEMAAHAFSMAVEFDPENEAAKHMLATITADATMERASNTYVKSLFDDYAKNFEHSLVQELGYTGYERLRRGFDRAFHGKPPIFDLVVDGGCGTGLAGEQFRNVSRTLMGVDLSEAIIQQAVEKRPNLYDETIAGDLMVVVVERKPISLIVAADSYIYFGDLDPLFEAMHDGLEHSGYAAFTLENVDIETESTLAETKPDWRWQLTASGRFAHRKQYVIDTGEKHDLHLVHYEALDGFRYERGVAVRGQVFILRKGRADQEL